MASSVTRDEVEIREIIARQFGAMSWKEGEGPDFDKFRSDFHPEARLFASARPLSPQSVTDFEKRMSGIAGTSLRTFDEKVLGCEITVFGNVAIAAVAYENTENHVEVNRNVEMMLLAKDLRQWQIVAQAWDKETRSSPIPQRLL